MDIENIFAAEVFNARRTAAEAGSTQTVTDLVSMALSDLCAFYTAGHISRERFDAIASKYVRYDADDEPWPRDDVDWMSVVRAAVI